MCASLFLGSVLCYVSILCVSLYANAHHFDYCSFIMRFEIRKCESFSFVLLFQDCFGYLGSLEIPYEF